FSPIVTSTSSASGKTATVTVEVWIRPLDSVTGTRCTRLPPRSNFSRLQAPLPWMNRITSLNPPTPVGLASITSTRHRCRSAYFRVHPGEIGGEERRLVAAGAGADLDEDVLVVVGIARQ